MKLTLGYKQTEVGVIPEDWDVKSIQDFSTIQTGPFGTLLAASEYSEYEGVPLISVGEIGVGRFKVTDHTPRVPVQVVRRLPQYVLRVGDIVFGRKGAVDRSAIVTIKEEGWFLGSDGISVRPSGKCCSPYLAAQFQRHEVRSWLLQNAVGTTMASLNQGILGSVKIPNPKLAEQQLIAETLSDADALIGSLEQLLAKKRLIKQGAMQELLTGVRRLPGFSGGWVEEAFGELAGIRSERIDPRKISKHEFCVELEHIGSATGCLLGHGETSEQSALKSVFYPGDVLFGKLRAYLRKYWLAEKGGVCSTEIWCLYPRGLLKSNQLLFQLIQMNSFIEVASMAYGTHMPRSDWKSVKELVVKLPSDELEQLAIADTLSTMDSEISSIECRLQKARHLKQGMMQELLTGRIRLV